MPLVSPEDGVEAPPEILDECDEGWGETAALIGGEELGALTCMG